MGRSAQVLQLKVTLVETSPAIWRQIQISSDCTFWGLHVAIQDAMGWTDSHLHMFELAGKRGSKAHCFGIPDDDGDLEVRPGWEFSVSKFLKAKGDKARYLYDFGDCWDHDVILEELLPALPKTAYPRCIAGERRCPPEDCGGVYGFENFLKIMKNRRHKEHKEMVDWAGGEFDPEEFNAADVHFEDPRKRLKFVLQSF